MALAEDIEMLKCIRDAHFVNPDAIDRAIAALEPLAGLDTERLEYLLSRAEMIGAQRAHIPFKCSSWRALAASLTALRGQR